MAGREQTHHKDKNRILEPINRQVLANEVNQVERHEHDKEQVRRRGKNIKPLIDFDAELHGEQGEEKEAEGVVLGNVGVLKGLFEVSVEIEKGVPGENRENAHRIKKT